MALLRTTITDKTLMQIYGMGFSEIYIWLDSDEAGVKGAAKVSKTLRHFLPSDVRLMTIHSDDEPKHLTPEQLDKKFL
jgi:DNA primase